MIWDALVNLIHANVTNNPAFYRMGVWKRVGVWVAMWGGAGAMAVIGKWA